MMGRKPAADTPGLSGRSRRGVKRLLPRTLFGRSLVIMVTPVVLAQLLATWIFYDRHWETMTNRLAYAVAGDIAFIIAQLDRDATANERRWTLVQAARATDLIVAFEPGNHLPPDRRRPRGMLESTLAAALAERVHRPFTVNTQIAYEWHEIRVELADGVLSVMSPERRLYSPTTYIFILWMIGSSTVLFTIAIIFMRNQIRPIRRLALAAERFGKGREVANFKLEGADEVRQAASAFLKMRERIQRQISQRTEMLAGVSHDLRTPLTRMRLQLAMMGDSPDVEELLADVAEMEQMIEGYLAFARGEGAEAVQPADLARLIQEAVSGARREGANVDLSIEGSLHLPVRPNAVRRCLANLLANARRHAARAWVTAHRTGSTIEIAIDDDGPGIPEKMRDEVFRPFFRLDPSRNPATGGTGLGLTIARDIARSHGGDVILADSPRGGLRAVVRLPL
ncbi:MAG TPA: ATP-binding protein [Azospirillaceae bacterium]|nr:ATP-binding protein [Azospirillaceae bacterium]